MWLKHVSIPQTMGVELIDQILSQRPSLFRDKPVFTHVIRNQVHAVGAVIVALVAAVTAAG